MPFTATEKLKEVEREISLRRRFYDRWISEGKMSKEMAARQIGVMEEIAADYRSAAEKERLL